MVDDLKRELSLLKILHDVDFALLTIEDRLHQIPGRRHVAEADCVALREAMAAKLKEKEEAEKGRRSDELELAAEVDRVREREAKLYAIKTNKEYQAALKEIADTKKINREREDRVLKLMETIEAAGKEITQLSAALADKEAGCRDAVQAIEAEAAQLEQEQGAQSAERERVVGDIGEKVMRLYTMVRQRHRDAVAEVRQGICQGCHMRIPPQQFIELQRWTALTQCPSCHRVLCPPDEAATAGPK